MNEFSSPPHWPGGFTPIFGALNLRCSRNQGPLVEAHAGAAAKACDNMAAGLLRRGNTTAAAVEATSERSFMSALNERECARSSQRQRLNGPRLAAEGHQGCVCLCQQPRAGSAPAPCKPAPSVQLFLSWGKWREVDEKTGEVHLRVVNGALTKEQTS